MARSQLAAMIENEGLAAFDNSMIRVQQCFQRLQSRRRPRAELLLQPCRWLGGSYPDSPVASSKPVLSELPALPDPTDGRVKEEIAFHEDAGSEGDVSGDDLRNAALVWDYMLMKNNLEKSDVILTLGNNDVRVASHASELWLRGYADWLLFSGELGNLTKGKWTRPEAEVFRDVAVEMGVPPDKIILENRATNTGENIRFAYEVLRARGLDPKRIILVQMPFMERRAYATFMKQWPGDVSNVQVLVTSPPISLTEYPNDEVGSLPEIISILIGCLQRVEAYPKKGYQIHQDIPAEVWKAYEELRDKQTYKRFLLKSDR